jgi:hypothetical protein
VGRVRRFEDPQRVAEGESRDSKKDDSDVSPS